MKIMNATSDYRKSTSMVEINTCLLKVKSDVHQGTVNERSNPNLMLAWNKDYTEPDEIRIENGKNSQKGKNLKNNGIIYYCIDNPDLTCQGVKNKDARRSGQIISEIVLTAEKILLKILSPNNMDSEKIISYVQTTDGIILRINQSYLLLSMGL